LPNSAPLTASQPALKAMGVDPFERLVINPRRPRIRAATAIGFKQDVLATDLVPKGVEAEGCSALAFVCSEVCSFSTVSDGVRRLIVNRRAVSPSLAWVASLRRRYPASTVVRTQPPSASAGAALTGSPLAWNCPSPPRSETSLVAHHSCSMRAAIITPVESLAAYLLASPTTATFPVVLAVGSHIDSFEAFSMFTHVAARTVR
jgi:hypothetical protein